MSNFKVVDSNKWFIKYDHLFVVRKNDKFLLLRTQDDDDLCITFTIKEKELSNSIYKCQCNKTCLLIVENNRRIVKITNEKHNCQLKSFKNLFFDLQKWTCIFGSIEDIKKLEEVKEYDKNRANVLKIIPQEYWMIGYPKNSGKRILTIKKFDNPHLYYEYTFINKRNYQCSVCKVSKAYYVKQNNNTVRVAASIDNHKCNPKLLENVVEKQTQCQTHLYRDCNEESNLGDTRLPPTPSEPCLENACEYKPSVEELLPAMYDEIYPKQNEVTETYYQQKNYIPTLNPPEFVVQMQDIEMKNFESLNNLNIQNLPPGHLNPIITKQFLRPSDLWQLNCCEIFDIQSTEDMYSIWSKLQKVDFSSNILPEIKNKKEFDNVYSLISYYLTGEEEYMLKIKHEVKLYIFKNRKNLENYSNLTDEQLFGILITDTINMNHFDVISKLLKCIIISYNYDEMKRDEYNNGDYPTIVIGIQNQKYFLLFDV